MSERAIVIGVMGGGTASPEVASAARRLGGLVAKKGWVLLNGGRNCGVMEASARGAKEMGGLTIGVLPDSDRRNVSAFIDVPIVTGMGQARNSINVLSSDIVVACRGGAGTLSEIALAIKSGKPVVLLDYLEEEVIQTFSSSGLIHLADTPEAAVEIISKLLSEYR
jgi:uncharacterized protein (TIGR00725 family)